MPRRTIEQVENLTGQTTLQQWIDEKSFDSQGFFMPMANQVVPEGHEKSLAAKARQGSSHPNLWIDEINPSPRQSLPPRRSQVFMPRQTG